MSRFCRCALSTVADALLLTGWLRQVAGHTFAAGRTATLVGTKVADILADDESAGNDRRIGGSMRDPIPATLVVVDRTLDLATPCMHTGGALFARCLSVLSPYGGACNGTTFSVPVAPDSMPTLALSGTRCRATAAMPCVAAESGEGGGVTAGAAGAGAGAGVSHTETGPGETGACASGVEDAVAPIMKEGTPSLCVETDTGVTEALLEGLFSGRGVGPSLVHAHTSSVSGLHDLVVDVLTAPRPTVEGESPALPRLGLGLK